MSGIDPLAVGAAAIAAFLLSGAWYALLPSPAGEGSPPPQSGAPSPPILLAEFLRSAVVATVVAGLAAEFDPFSAGEGALLGLVLWVGFPAVLFAGSILHERYPAKLATLHLGDWLLTLILIGAVVGAVQ